MDELDDGSGARARVCEGGGGGCGLGVMGSEAAPYIGAGPGLGVRAKEGRERRGGVKIRARIQVHREEGDRPDKWGSPVGSRTREGRRGWAGEGARWAGMGRAERKGERKKTGRAKEKERRRSWARLLGWAQKREGERKGFTFFKKI